MMLVQPSHPLPDHKLRHRAFDTSPPGGGCRLVGNTSVNGGVFAPGSGTSGTSMTVTGTLGFTAVSTYAVNVPSFIKKDEMPELQQKLSALFTNPTDKLFIFRRTPEQYAAPLDFHGDTRFFGADAARARGPWP